MFTTINSKRNAEIIRRRKAGEQPRHIAPAMGLTRNTVIGVLQRAGLCEPEGQRVNTVRGEEVGSSKLDPEKVREIRRSKESAEVLGSRFGVCAETIRHARFRRSWAHVI